MLADILSRLVETVAEQGDDMQVGSYSVPHDKILDLTILKAFTHYKVYVCKDDTSLR